MHGFFYFGIFCVSLQYGFKNFKAMEYTIRIAKNKDGWLTGRCEQVPEAITQGKDMNELMTNMKEAIEFILLDRQEEFRKENKLKKSDKVKTLRIGNEKKSVSKILNRKRLQTT